MTQTELKKKIALAIKEKKRFQIGCGCSVVADILPSGFCKLSFRTKTQDGKRAKIKLGEFPKMSLVEAWAKADQIKKGEANPDNNIVFGSYLDAFIEEKRLNGKNKKRSSNLRSYLKHVNFLNDMPFSKIDSLKVAEELRALRNSKLSQANLSLIVGALNQYLDWCVKHRYADFNPCLPLKDLKEFKRHPTTGYACVKPEELKDKFFIPLAKVDPFIKCFYLALAFTGVRFDGVRHMRWDWIKSNKIYIPAKHTKTSKDFVCPVSEALSNVFKTLNKLQNNLGIDSPYLFSITGERIAGEDVFRRPLRQYLEKDKNGNVVHSLHGFRKVFKTWCQVQGAKTKQVSLFGVLSELQLSHASKNKLENVYGKYDYLDERAQLMNDYSEFIKSQLSENFLKICE